jgi:hypothetical protein
MALVSVRSRSVTVANCPGHSELLAFSKVALSWIVPVVVSTVLFTKLRVPRALVVCPWGVASTVSVPLARSALMGSRKRSGTANTTLMGWMRLITTSGLPMSLDLTTLPW